MLAYSFKALAADIQYPARTLGVHFSHKGGRALFKMNPGAYNELEPEARALAKEKLEGVPITAKMIITFDPAEGDFFICAFDAWQE